MNTENSLLVFCYVILKIVVNFNYMTNKLQIEWNLQFKKRNVETLVNKNKASNG